MRFAIKLRQVLYSYVLIPFCKFSDSCFKTSEIQFCAARGLHDRSGQPYSNCRRLCMNFNWRVKQRNFHVCSMHVNCQWEKVHILYVSDGACSYYPTLHACVGEWYSSEGNVVNLFTSLSWGSFVNARFAYVSTARVLGTPHSTPPSDMGAVVIR